MINSYFHPREDIADLFKTAVNLLHRSLHHCKTCINPALFLCLFFFSSYAYSVPSGFDTDKPVINYNQEYHQVFNPDTGWDNETFYAQWEAIQSDIFNSEDIQNGYLQFVWIPKRIICSRNKYPSPYIFETDLDHSAGSNRGGIVIRAAAANELLQEPVEGDPGYNSEGIAFYPTEDGDAMIIQFTGIYNGTSTPVTRIQVPKSSSLPSLMSRALLRIEDFDSTIYVYHNDLPFIRIDLSNKTDNVYTSGTVYDSNMEIAGSFSGMEIEARGKIAVAQRDAALRLYAARICYTESKNQEISFLPVGRKLTTDAPFSLTASSSSGLPLNIRILSGPAVLEGEEITLTGEPGIVEILLQQEGDQEYYPATEQKILFNVIAPEALYTDSNSQSYVNNWVVTDALGRTLPSYKETGPVRENKKVGVFYYIWHGFHNKQVYLIPEILASYPEDPLSPENTAWGPESAFHFWGEPETGFHRSDDPWVIRRDLQMLSNAQVDFLYLDVTNSFTYLETVKTLCETSMIMRTEGIHTPQIAFTTHANSGEVMNSLYDDFYQYGLYSDLWFYQDGKPLILGDPADSLLREDVKEFFTIKFSWAWTDAKNTPNHWQWIDHYPQDYGWSTDPSIADQIPVSVAQHPTNNKGTSYSNFIQPTVNENYVTDYTGQGLHFAEQWERALEVDPEVIMATQWNEWIAQRFIWENGNSTFAGRPIKNGDSYFVDVFTEEFNRDMAPMKGGHTDNYYYQLISNIRKFKGMTAPPRILPSPDKIVLDGDISDWISVLPVFKDPEGDIMHRDFKGYDPDTQYINLSGRNDIIESRVSYDDSLIWFSAVTVDNLSPHTDSCWMMLYLDIDRNKGTGWEGYDFLANYKTLSETETLLSKWNGSEWIVYDTINYAYQNNILELAIPENSLLLSADTPEFYFHWADNQQKINEISSFFTNGESAPDRRFNYNYSSSEIEEVPQTAYTSLSIPGTIEFEDFDQGGAGNAYSDATIGNSGKAYRLNESVDIAGPGDEKFYITDIDTDEWLEYSVDINAIGTFLFSIKYKSESDNNKIRIEVNGVEKMEAIALPANEIPDSWAEKNVELQLNSGTAIVRFYIEKANHDLWLDKVEISEQSVVYPGDGTGLTMSLWQSSYGGRQHFIDSACAITDAEINEYWNEESPGCGVEKDFWNARWEGWMEPLFSEKYTFYLTVNDMGKLWINNTVIVNAWASSYTNKTISGTMNLTAGEKYPIRLDYSQKTGDGKIQLEWESASNPREIIPQHQLFPLSLKTSIINDIKKIKLYPNPASDYLCLDSGNKTIREISIFDIQGRNLFTSKESFYGKKTFYLSLKEGLYFVKVQDNEKTSLHRLIIQ